MAMSPEYARDREQERLDARPFECRGHSAGCSGEARLGPDGDSRYKCDDCQTPLCGPCAAVLGGLCLSCAEDRLAEEYETDETDETDAVGTAHPQPAD